MKFNVLKFMMLFILFFVFSYSVNALPESTFSKVEYEEDESSSYPPLELPSNTNYVEIKKGSKEVAIWTKYELNDEQKNVILNFVKGKDNSLKGNVTPMYYFGYGEKDISTWGRWMFEEDNDKLIVTPLDDAGSHIGYGLFADIYVGNLVIKNSYQLGNDEKEIPDYEASYTVKVSDDIPDGMYGDVEFVSNEARFTLKGGESITISNLPALISYTITLENSTMILLSSDNTGNTIEENGIIISTFTYQSKLNSSSNKPAVVNPDTEDYIIATLVIMLLSLLAIKYFNNRKHA